MQLHTQLAIQQHDRFAHGLQHRRSARSRTLRLPFSLQAAADLSLQQPQHQAEQRQLHQQRAPRYKVGLPLLSLRLGGALGQQRFLAGLQLFHQAADRVARAQVLHQLALVAVRLGLRQLTRNPHTTFQHRLDAADADQLVGIVAGHPAQFGQPLGDVVGLGHALAQARRIHALGQRQCSRFDVAHIGLQLLQGHGHLLGMGHPAHGQLVVLLQFAQGQPRDHDDGCRCQCQSRQSPAIPDVITENQRHSSSSAQLWECDPDRIGRSGTGNIAQPVTSLG
ncbi:hypothetical protein D3C73_977410 [compost metagenome]